MNLDVFWLLLIHFRIVRSSVLPIRDSPAYHLLENIYSFLEYLRQKFLSKLSLGWKICSDEGRAVS